MATSITLEKAAALAETYITLEGIKTPSSFEKDFAVKTFLAGGVFTYEAMGAAFDDAADALAEMEMECAYAHGY